MMCEKNRLIKYKKALRHIVAKRDNWKNKESNWCSEADFYLILSNLLSIIDLIITNYRKNEIGIKRYEED